MTKIIRVTTIPGSLLSLLSGQLKYMSQFFEVIAISGKGERYKGRYQLEKVVNAEGVRSIEVEMTRKITPIKDFLAVLKLYRVFKKEKPQLVHSHTPKAGTLSMIAAKYAGVPHRWHTVAGLPLVEAVGIKRKVLNTVERITYAHATKILPNSNGLKTIILDHQFTNKQKLEVIGHGSSNGIDTSYFDPNLYSQQQKDSLKQHLRITREDFVFIFMGRLVKDKGINELITAFNKIQKKNSNVKLLLLGSYEKELDPLLPEIEYQIENNTAIVTTGWIKDVRPYLAISNVLVFPSYREGFPNTVMQACAMGLPSIVSDINGCNEIITHHKNGIIIPTKDKTAIENAMLQLLNSKKLYTYLAQNSRVSIIDKYERNYVWGQLLKKYTSVLSV